LVSHNAATDGARELFKPSEDVENLVFSMKKLEIFGFGFAPTEDTKINIYIF